MVRLQQGCVIGGSLKLVWSFCPKILGPWWGPTNGICHSVNMDVVLLLLEGGGDTSTLLAVIKIV